MIKEVKINEIYFYIPGYEEYNALRFLIPRLIDLGAEKIGFFDGRFPTFKGGSGMSDSQDASIIYLEKFHQVEVHKMGVCWLEEKNTAAFKRAAELGYKYVFLLGCDEYLDEGIKKFNVDDSFHLGRVNFVEHNPNPDQFNIPHPFDDRLFINPGEIEGKISHFEYFEKSTGRQLKTACIIKEITIHHNDLVRKNPKRNKEMFEYQKQNIIRENSKRAKYYIENGLFKIYIAIPTLGKINSELATWLINVTGFFSRKLYSPNSEGMIVAIKILRPMDSNRNFLVEKFLESDCTHLLFIDDDMVPPPGMINKFLEHDKDVIAPRLPVWFAEKGIIIAAMDKSYPPYEFKLPVGKGLVSVDFVGAGLSFIKRKVFEIVPKPCYRFTYKESGVVEFAEDVNFCKLARQHGIGIFVDADFTAKHIKEIELTKVIEKYTKADL